MSDEYHGPDGVVARNLNNQIRTRADLDRAEEANHPSTAAQGETPAARRAALNISTRERNARGVQFSGDGQSTALLDGGGAVGVSGPHAPDKPGRYPAITAAVDPVHRSPVPPSQWTPDTIVTIEGVGTMDLVTAEMAGYLAPQGGQQGQRQAPQQQQPQEKEEEAKEPHADLVTAATNDQGAEEIIGGVVETVDAGTQLEMVQQIVENGEVDEHTLARVAGQQGIEPGQVHAQIARVQQAFTDQAADAVREVLGDLVDPVEFLQDAYVDMPEETRAAMTRQATMRQPDGYRDLARTWLEGLDQRDPEAILGADFGPGVSADQRPDGTVVITTPQGEFAWRSAVSNGLIGLSRAGKRGG